MEPEDHASLGLGPNSTVIEALYQAGKIGSRSWALDQGMTGMEEMGLGKWIDGQLTLGGYDKSRYVGDMVSLPISNDPECSLRVLVESMVVSNGTVSRELTLKEGAAKPTPFRSVYTPSGLMIC